MKIISMENGFFETHEQRKAEFFEKLEPLKGKYVRFLGSNEPTALHQGYLKEFGGDTVTFSNGVADLRASKEWTYPYSRVMIAVEDTVE